MQTQTDPARRDAALETIARGELTIQGPVMLKQGFMGLVPRLPIFLEGVAPGDVDAALKSIG
jgi:sensor domain CHASE-containing protein